MNNTTKQHSSFYGPLMMLFASFCFAGGGTALKLIPWNPLAINGARNLISAFVLGAYLLISHHKVHFNLTVIIGVICATGTTTLYTMANKMTTAGNAVILQYTAPIWVIIFTAIFFHKKPSKLEIATTAVVLVGICCFFFDSIGGGSFIGDVCALLSGIFYAGLFMMNHFEKGDILASTFLSQVVCGLVLSPLVTRETQFPASAIYAIIFLGLIQLGLAYIFFNEGTRYTRPVTSCLINGVEPVLNPLLVAIIFGEMLTTMSFVGAIIVIGAILTYNILCAKHKG